ncbi:MAG: hypothetical protein ACI4TI_00340, partial [Christensenellales bacterium]
NDPEFIKQNPKLYFSIVASQNEGTIKNVIVYFDVELDSIDFDADENTFWSVCKNFENCERVSEFASKLVHKTGTKDFNNTLDEHEFCKNVQTPSKNADGNYEISTSEEFAYLLISTETEIRVVLKNDIDFKGKIFDNISKKITIFGEGFVLRNLIVLNSSCLFDNVCLNETAIENAVVLNFETSSNFIKQSSGINNSYVEFDINNFENVIFENLAKINNSYFVASKPATFVKTNNDEVNNTYLINLSMFKANIATNNNLVIFDLNNLEGVEAFVQNAKNFNNDNGIENLWFVDSNLVVGQFALPKLKGVGNVVWQFVYDTANIELNALFTKILSGNFVVTKNRADVTIGINMTNTQQKLADILINSQSKIDEFNKTLQIITLKDSGINFNIVEIVTELKTYNVTIKVNITGKGNLVKFGEHIGEEIVVSCESGTKFSELGIETIASAGYSFVGFDFVDNLGNVIEESDQTILSDLTVVANFKNLICYKLNLSGLTNVTIYGNKLDAWTNVATDIYEIYLTELDDINDYLPEISKQDYVLKGYSQTILSLQKFEMRPSFEADYVVVKLEYDTSCGTAMISSENEYSLTSPELKIVQTDEKDTNSYRILRGYQINLSINFNGTYLTKILINTEDLLTDYSAYVEKDDEVNFTLAFDENFDENIVEIEFENIMLETKFEFDNNFVRLEIENGTIDLATFTVSSKKNSDLIFALNIEESKILDKISFLDAGVEFEPEITIENNKYYYKVKQNATITIALKQKTLTVLISSTVGGEVNLISEQEKTQIDDKNYSFVVEFEGNFEILITPYDGYKISSIKISDGQDYEVYPYIKIENLKEDLNIVVEFKKLASWLDVDENNEPLYFSLSKFGGLGTSENPYLISSLNDFLTMAYNVNILNVDYSNVYFKAIRRDMTLNFARYYFNPITNFNGTILGDNLTLQGIKICANQEVGVFKVLGANALIKSIVVEGSIEGNFKVGSIAAVNNGTIIGCANKAIITNNNNYFDDKNITGGICAENNGKILRCYNLGSIYATSVKTAGICAINNGEIENIYNTGTIYSLSEFESDVVVAGICAQNNSSIKIGYVDSRIINKNSNQFVEIVGTAKNSSGNYSDLYFNSNKLNLISADAKTFNELSDNQNAIYENFDKDVWLFSGAGLLPVLKVMYEYLGSVSFSITFDDNLTEKEKLVMVELSNGTDQNYGLVLENSNRIYKIS